MYRQTHSPVLKFRLHQQFQVIAGSTNDYVKSLPFNFVKKNPALAVASAGRLKNSRCGEGPDFLLMDPDFGPEWGPAKEELREIERQIHTTMAHRIPEIVVPISAM
jgi:hypothetical protein